MNCEEIQQALRRDSESLTEHELAHIPDCAECFAIFESRVETPFRKSLCTALLNEDWPLQSRRQWNQRRIRLTHFLPLAAAILLFALFFPFADAPPTLEEIEARYQRLSEHVTPPRTITSLTDYKDSTASLLPGRGDSLPPKQWPSALTDYQKVPEISHL